jgi:fatty-acyl-CoA synthase
VAVIGLPDERWIEAVTAVVVPRGEVTEAELLDHARENLAHFKAPKRVFLVDALPRNASGKILKRDLRDRFGAS